MVEQCVRKRMEKLKFRAHSSTAKLIGTIVSITGALVVTLYKGLPLINNNSNPSSINTHLHLQMQSDWVWGGFLLACGAFVLSLLFIVLVCSYALTQTYVHSISMVIQSSNTHKLLQTWIVRDYPAEMMMATIGSVFVVMESSFVALIVERDRPEAWTMKPGIEFIAIILSVSFSLLSN